MNIDLEKAEKKLIQSIDPKIKSHVIDINNFKIHYNTLGKGNPLILIHGATLGWGQWYANIKELSKKFKVIAVDLPGAGKSSRVKFAHHDLEKIFVDTIAAFVNKMELKKPVVVGHSFGGWVGLKLGQKYPEKIKKVVAINPVGMTQEIPQQFRPLSLSFMANVLNTLILGRSESKTEKFLKSVQTKPNTKLNTSFIKHFHHARSIERTDSLFHLISSTLEKGTLKKRYIIFPFLKKIRIPTLIIWGLKDVSMLYPHALEKVNNKKIELHIYPHSGHIPFIEEAKHFNNLLLTFLEE